MMRLNTKAEKRLFKWDEIKHLTKKEMYHLFIESGITGWSGVQQQKQRELHGRAAACVAREGKCVWLEQFRNVSSRRRRAA